jgi:SAM-dependent methyltransferase
MDRSDVRAKFGDDYEATERTFKLGIDQRFTAHMASRFRGRRVLETCSGGGFTTIALARAAEYVVSLEIDPDHLSQARQNVERAGLLDRVTFLCGDALDEHMLDECRPIDAAFLDPDWAVSGPDHVYRFRSSNTRPPADALLERALALTADVALVLPPRVDTLELYFGSLARATGVTQLRV